MAQTTQDYPEIAGQIARLVRGLEEIAWKVNSTLDPDVLLRSIVQSVTTYSPWSICWVGVIDQERQEVAIHADAGLVPGYSAAETREWPLANSPTMLAIQRGKPLTVPDILAQDDFPLLREDGLRRGYRSFLVLPLELGDAQGAIWFKAPQPRTFSDEEVAYASVIAAQVATALRNSRLFQRERELRCVDQARVLELERLNQLAAHQNELLERLNSSHTRLIEIVLSDRGLGALADATSQLFGNPTRVFDRFRRLLAGSDTGEPEVGALFQDPGLQARLDHLERQHRAAIVDGPTGRCILAPVATGRTVLGCLCVQERWRPFDPLDVMLAEQVALLVALELMKERIRVEAELRLKTDFIDALLSGEAQETSDLARRGALLGLDLARPSQVLLVEIDPSHGEAQAEAGSLFDLQSSLHEVVDNRLGRRARGVASVVYSGGRLVVVAPADGPADVGGEDLATSIRQAVAEAVPVVSGWTVSVGVGRPYAGSAGVRRSYLEALKALKIARALGQHSTVVHFAQAGIYELLLSDDGFSGLQSFAEPLLGPLVTYDERRHGSLLETLDAFLSCGCNVHKAAETLFLHVTTVRYRLARIEEITGLDLEDAENRLRLHVALKIHRLVAQPPTARTFAV